MAEKNVQIKFRNSEGGYDNIFPKTKVGLVDGLSTSLDGKVNKEPGKGLSTEDYTTIEKNKLAGVEAGANNYTHPATHPASMIVESTEKRFVSDSEKTSWNNKEDKSNKGQPNGYAGLDANGKVPLSQLPDASKSQTYVVSDSTERNAITGMLEGDKAFETSTGDSYIYDGSVWRVLAQADWENVNLDWNNITNAPSSSPSNIDDAVNIRHGHINKSTLDKITDTGSKTSYDLAQFVTQSDLNNAGYGDMLKSVYDKNNNGKVDVAEKAESVPWNGVTDKPSKFPPSNHSHNANEISESSNKRFVTDEQILTWNAKTKIVISTTDPDDADIWYQEI